MESEAYDIVGDVHGMIRTLGRLVQRLGYRHDGTSWSHPGGRVLVFVGDLIDRGPDPLGCLELAAGMVGDGVARMTLGNHEINALHYTHEPPLRERTEKNTKQFAATLSQKEADEARWERARAFIMTCPTRLELDGGRLRVIHACWHEPTLPELPLYIDDQDLMRRTAKGGRSYAAVDSCIKGPEEPCDPFPDKDGHIRHERRIPWWESYDPAAPFIVFGHYWFPWKGAGREHTPATPALLGSGNAACVDYSAGKGGPLVALRYPEREFVLGEFLDEAPQGRAR